LTASLAGGIIPVLATASLASRARSKVSAKVSCLSFAATRFVNL
jgi:hypothetical protein